jgi:hypothetical protein
VTARQRRTRINVPGDPDAQARIVAGAAEPLTPAVDTARVLARELTHALRVLDGDEQDEVLGALYREIADPDIA